LKRIGYAGKAPPGRAVAVYFEAHIVLAIVNPRRTRTRFTKEFKLEAVRLLELGQKPATQLALELNVARNQLYKWQAQLPIKDIKVHNF